MIQRYRPVYDDDFGHQNTAYLVEDDDGDVLKYNDHAAVLSAKDAELIKLAESFIQFVWHHKPQCWDTLDELEALLSKLTGVPEDQISRKWAKGRRKQNG